VDLFVAAIGPGTRVLVLLAHPDDEALLCGGTLAAMSNELAEVLVVCFADGAQGRETLFHDACAELGATGELLHHRTNHFVLDGGLVGAADELVRRWRPSVVITHTEKGTQNQDHVALHDAVRLSVMRWSEPALVLAAEPSMSSVDFTPNVFVDVTLTFQTKLAAVKRYRDALPRDFMDEDYLRTRAAWWGQVCSSPRRLYEAFELMLWR
jgi:N-acetylglucosamine malate deacetylase 1